MLRVPVSSTTIASIGFDRRKRELEIEFRATGDVYRYFDVPGLEHSAFMAAESKGTYLNQVFKSQGYRYRVVRKRREQLG
jgi:KTSC domain